MGDGYSRANKKFRLGDYFMTSKISVKISDVGISFLKKLKKNRIKADIDEEGLSYWKLLEVISKFFKNDNEAYLKLVETMEIQK